MTQTLFSHSLRGVHHEYCGAYSEAQRAELCVFCYQTKNYFYHDIQEQTETIDQEAHRIVYGDREQTYDDPSRNFRKLAYMFQGVLDGKLKTDSHITENDVALMLICLKISRESFKPNRENRVDGIGYWLCLDRIVEAQQNDGR